MVETMDLILRGNGAIPTKEVVGEDLYHLLRLGRVSTVAVLRKGRVRWKIDRSLRDERVLHQQSSPSLDWKGKRIPIQELMKDTQVFLEPALGRIG